MQEKELLTSIEKLFDTKIDAVKNLLSQAVEDLDKRFNTNTSLVASQTIALRDAAQKATDIQAIALEKRLSAMNEFRATLQDQAINFYTRQEHEVFAKGLEQSFKSIDSDLRILREARAEIAGLAKASQLYLTFILALVGAVSGIVGLILRITNVG